MATINKYGMIASYRCLLALFIVMALPLLLLMQSQKSYAETKKVTGTCKLVKEIVSYKIPCPTGGGVTLRISLLMLHSDDPHFNNVYQTEIAISEKDSFGSSSSFANSGYTINTYSNGDQTWSLYDGTVSRLPPQGWTSERKSYSMGGTGKYEGFESSSVVKKKTKGQGWNFEMESCEWEMEYEIKK